MKKSTAATRPGARLGILYDSGVWRSYRGVKAICGIVEKIFMTGDPVQDYLSARTYGSKLTKGQIQLEESVERFIKEPGCPFIILDGRLTTRHAHQLESLEVRLGENLA